MEQEGEAPSQAGRQIKPPPLSQHLREFVRSPHAWAVLGRNLIPVVGIYAFGWSAALSVFSYWFDGLTALAAIVAAVVVRLVREMPTTEIARWQRLGIGAKAGKIATGVVTWVFLVGIIALPYWIVLIPLHNILLGHEVRRELMHSPVLWLIFGSLAAGHFGERSDQVTTRCQTRS